MEHHRQEVVGRRLVRLFHPQFLEIDERLFEHRAPLFLEFDLLREFDVAHPVGPFGEIEEHTSELQSLMRISYAVFCLKKKKHIHTTAPLSAMLTTKHNYMII